ncbi:MAG: chromate transporter [Acidobacteria bacterium]|nr:chromate transporter [Acidobacteriota bacterium]
MPCHAGHHAGKRSTGALLPHNGGVSAPQPTASHDVPGPRSLTELYWAFTILALQGFGGVLAVVQRELVERRRWLTREEFVEDWAVAQILPGPNVVNMTVMFGDRHFGWRGAAAAFAGVLTVPSLVVLTMAIVFENVADTAEAQGALRGMGAVVAGLITATGLKLMPALEVSPIGRRQALAVLLLTFAVVGIVRLPLVWVLAGVGSSACLWTWFCLKQLDDQRAAAQPDVPTE